MNKNTISNLFSIAGIGLILVIPLSVFENNLVQTPKSELSWANFYFNEALAAKEKKEDKKESIEIEICNKLFDSETCEKMKIKEEESKPVEKKPLTEEERKNEAILNKYLELVEPKQLASSSPNNKTGIESIPNGTQNNTSPTLRPSSSNDNISDNIKNLENLDQFQLVDIISTSISNANNIDKSKVTQALNDFIEPTKASGASILEPLKNIAEVILEDPTGNTAEKIINVAKTK